MKMQRRDDFCKLDLGRPSKLGFVFVFNVEYISPSNDMARVDQHQQQKRRKILRNTVKSVKRFFRVVMTF